MWAQERADLDRIGVMIATAVGGPMAGMAVGGMSGGGGQNIGFVPGIGQVSTYGSNVPQGFPAMQTPGPTSNMLGQVSSSQLNGMNIQQLLALLGKM